MKYFWSEGGNNRPYFAHRVKVNECTTAMYEWCTNYPDHDRPFRNFHVEWSDVYDKRGYDIVQFQSKDAYLAFTYAFAGEYIEANTIV